MADIDSHANPLKQSPTPNHLNTVMIPFFPSQTEPINPTVSSRSWELFQLLFVGIAVCYGLFSRKADESEKENGTSKFDNAQSYVSRLLQVSSVFDEEIETLTGSDDSNKIQTWNNQYLRNEPVVVVAKENSVFDEYKVSNSSRISEKPLSLPVRSLKYVEYSNGDAVLSNSKLGSQRISKNGSNSRIDESKRGMNSQDLGENVQDKGVLPSPIPWRSRSGRMEFKEEVNCNDGGLLMEESQFNGFESRSFRSQNSKPLKPISTSSSSSPKKLSPSPSMESQAKNVEDPVRKMSFNKSCPPPAPPPPPPPMSRKPPLMKSNLSSTNNGGIHSEHEFRRKSANDGDVMSKRVNSTSESKSRTQIDNLMMGKSVRTTRSNESFGLPGIFEDDSEIEEELMKQAGKKWVRFDQTLMRTDRSNRENSPIMPKTTFSENQKQNNKRDIFDEVTVETDEETESEIDDDDEDSLNAENGNRGGCFEGVNHGGPDVDKKADEFIAKFRQQIQLQRMASIRKSNGQINR